MLFVFVQQFFLLLLANLAIYSCVFDTHTHIYAHKTRYVDTLFWYIINFWQHSHKLWSVAERGGKGVDAERPEGKYKRKFEMLFLVTKTGVVLAELYHQCPLQLPKTIRSFSTFGFQEIHFGDSFGLWLHVPCRGHQIVGLLGSIFVKYA